MRVVEGEEEGESVVMACKEREGGVRATNGVCSVETWGKYDVIGG